MKICPTCQFKNTDDSSKYCHGCGAPLPVTPPPAPPVASQIICPRCNKPNPPLTRFCGNCAQPLVNNITSTSQLPDYTPSQPLFNSQKRSSGRPKGCGCIAAIFGCVLLSCGLLSGIGKNAQQTQSKTDSTVKETMSKVVTEQSSNSSIDLKLGETTVNEMTTQESMTDEEYREFIKTNIFQFDDINIYGPDSAGGWEFDIDIKNMAKEEIHYVYIEVAGVNAVGDIVWSETDFDDSPGVTLKLTGPIAQGEVGGRGKTWQGCFYNSTVDHFGINSLTIEYENGVLLTVNKDECSLAYDTYNEEH